NDLYVRFFRIAERRIVGDGTVRGNSDGRGMVCYISNNAWLDGLSHVSLRARYLREFQSIYIDNLNGDKYRTGKRTPDGRPDPSAFSTPQNREGIQVGTAITTLVRLSQTPTQGEVRIRQFWGATKLSRLAEEARDEGSPEYAVIAPPNSLRVSFIDSSQVTGYSRWPSLPDLFPVSFAGLQTARDSTLIDIDLQRLESRILRYLDPRLSEEEIHREMPVVMTATNRFDPVAVRQTLLQGGYKPWQVRRFLYRPFDIRWLYWEPKTKLLDEKREDFVRRVPFPCPLLIAQHKARMGANPPQIPRILSDLALMDRGAT